MVKTCMYDNDIFLTIQSVHVYLMRMIENIWIIYLLNSTKESTNWSSFGTVKDIQTLELPFNHSQWFVYRLLFH